MRIDVTRRLSLARSLSAAGLLLLSSGAANPATAGVAGMTALPAPSAHEQEQSLQRLLEGAAVGDVEPLRAARATFTSRTLQAAADAGLAASKLDLRGVRAARRTMDVQHAPPEWRATVLAAEAGVAFALGDYRLSSDDCAAWLAMPEDTDPINKRADMLQMGQIAIQLAALPKQTAARHAQGTTPTWRDKASLLRTRVRIGEFAEEMVVDTGANLSVMSESTAKRLGLTIGGAGSVRSSSRDAVGVRLAIASHLTIGDAALSNVVFLVLDDADLRLPLPGGYDIPAIIGLPVLRALGRLTFTSGSMEMGGRPRGHAVAAPLLASGSNMFVPAVIDGRQAPLHLDSGASNTSLGARFAGAHPEALKGLEKRSTRVAGAGGALEGSAYVLRNPIVEIGTARTTLPSIDIDAGRSDTLGYFGTLGQDLLRSKGGYTIDFDRMTFALHEAEPQG